MKRLLNHNNFTSFLCWFEKWVAKKKCKLKGRKVPGWLNFVGKERQYS